MDTDRSDPRIGRVQIGNTRASVACPFILSIPFIPLARLSLLSLSFILFLFFPLPHFSFPLAGQTSLTTPTHSC